MKILLSSVFVALAIISSASSAKSVDDEIRSLQARIKALETAGRAVPKGAVMAFNRNDCPNGWSEFIQARSRFVIGVGHGSGLTERKLNDVLGAEKYTLTEAQLPIHAHLPGSLAITTASGSHSHIPAGAYYIGVGVGGDAMMSTSGPKGPHNTMADGSGVHTHPSTSFSGATALTGGNQPFDVVPPFVALLFCQKD